MIIMFTPPRKLNVVGRLGIRDPWMCLEFCELPQTTQSILMYGHV